MAHAIALIQDPVTQTVSEAPVGFSWSMLFLGFLVSMYRGDWWVAFVCLFVTLWLGPIPNLFLCWCYNDWYLNRKLRSGYEIIQVRDL